MSSQHVVNLDAQIDKLFSGLWLDFSMENVVSIFVLIKETAWETPLQHRYSQGSGNTTAFRCFFYTS